MDNPQEISSLIVQLITDSPGTTLIGVRLGAKVRQRFNAFNPNAYKCRNLRHFISVYVPEVAEAGYAGNDVRYTLIEKQSGEPIRTAQPELAPNPLRIESEKLPINSFAWKAFTNPSDPFVVAINRATGDVRTLRIDSSPSEPWIVVPKPSAEFHKDLASEFSATLPEPIRTTLSALLYDPKWYVRFNGVATKNGLGVQWSAFRRTKLIAKFNAARLEAGAPAPRSAVSKYEALSPVILQPRSSPVETTTENEEFEFRNLILRVVAELPVSELRLLKLPIGVVFDASKK